MNTSNNRVLISSIGFGDNKMYIELNTSKILAIPYNYTQKLQNASIKDLKEYELIGDGIGIHFNNIDEDLSLNGIIRDFGNKSKRINISIKENLLEKIDLYSKEHHISRSALIQKATSNYIGLKY
jgi:hypothetical protein